MILWVELLKAAIRLDGNVCDLQSQTYRVTELFLKYGADLKLCCSPDSKRSALTQLQDMVSSKLCATHIFKLLQHHEYEVRDVTIHGVGIKWLGGVSHKLKLLIHKYVSHCPGTKTACRMFEGISVSRHERQ